MARISDKRRKDAVNKAISAANKLRERIENMTVEEFERDRYSLAVDVTNIVYTLRVDLNGQD